MPSRTLSKLASLFAGSRSPRSSLPPPELIDVKALIANFDIAEHARRADDYFKDIGPSSVQMTKPFMSFNTPDLLRNLAVVLENLDFFPGVRVVDFGAGSAWLAQSLALMGCEAIAVDVSGRALELGRAHTSAKYPEVADRIRYLVFDGSRIDLPDGSVDRIICFDSFHHVPNQEVVLREFHRVLTASGRAVFCEPGPTHSTHPLSQYEMRVHGVIENDIHIEDIWAMAQEIGFQRHELCVFTPRAVRCSIEEFKALSSYRTAQPLLRKVYRSQLKPLHDTQRLFVLFKGEETPDSRRLDGLSGALSARVTELADTFVISGTAKNTGDNVWLPADAGLGAVNVGVILRSADGVWNPDFCRIQFLDGPAAPGESRDFELAIHKAEVGESEVYVDLVSELIKWFGVSGGESLRLK
jgi:ubiquinone/menaquinone biosynthesis C-methylase UbiE